MFVGICLGESTINQQDWWFLCNSTESTSTKPIKNPSKSSLNPIQITVNHIKKNKSPSNPINRTHPLAWKCHENHQVKSHQNPRKIHLGWPWRPWLLIAVDLAEDLPQHLDLLVTHLRGDDLRSSPKKQRGFFEVKAYLI